MTEHPSPIPEHISVSPKSVSLRLLASANDALNWEDSKYRDTIIGRALSKVPRFISSRTEAFDAKTQADAHTWRKTGQTTITIPN